MVRLFGPLVGLFFAAALFWCFGNGAFKVARSMPCSVTVPVSQVSSPAMQLAKPLKGAQMSLAHQTKLISVSGLPKRTRRASRIEEQPVVRDLEAASTIQEQLLEIRQGNFFGQFHQEARVRT